MDKLLKPYTIIPSELYVKRDADRQLLNIIEDMGRPGYVLVSRQMGKTNLLLNAKREAETPDDIFVYIDLSNPFANAKDCFENIVDTILEINEDRLKEVSLLIKSNRKNNEGIPAHKQHTSELKNIINSIKGKLVIILDEIDALTKTEYSDRIFSQIRSIYFTRVNFPELSRLTYVLSGVVEPSEIIKDPIISPFNIGQKIFLNDFIYEEFEDFISKAKISLSDDVKKYIYHWTSGNPRITWDVCSEIESIVNRNLDITNDVVDEVIYKIYLTSFDKPPIDNIRELIKGDPELRNAIVEIEYNKGGSISDRIKSKLYLAGIINYTNGTVKIKNRVIRQSISLEWIKKIEEEEKGLLILASDFYKSFNYAECLLNFERFLENDKFPPKVDSLYYYYMGYSAYKLLDFEKSLKYLNQTDFDIEDNAMNYYLTQNIKGLNYLNTKKYDLSLQHFKSVLKRSKKDNIFASAIMNIGYICLLSDNILSISEAKKIFIDIIEERSIDPSQISKEQLQEFKTISYYNLAKLYEKEKGNDKPKEMYEKAVEISTLNKKPRIILDLLPHIKDEIERNKKIDLLLYTVESLSPAKYDYENPLDYNIDHFQDLLLAVYNNRNNNFLNLLKSNISHLETKDIGSAIYDLAFYAINSKSDLDISLKLFNDIYREKDNPEYEISPPVYYNALRLLAYFSSSSKEVDRVEQYLSLFQTARVGEVNFIDIEIFANYIYDLFEKGQFLEALNYVNLITSFKESVSEEYLINYLAIYNIELNIHLKLKHSKESILKAKEIIDFANNKNVIAHKSALLGDSGLDLIKSNAQSILKPNSDVRTPIKSDNKYGRNDKVRVKYKNGKILEDKYKKFASDIATGQCIIVD